MHPYTHLPASARWHEAVAPCNPLELNGLYQPKFAITPRDRITTGGSCFAQHIAAHLRAHHFDYRDMEPPPALLPPDLHRRFGYGVFSARYGNIYTTRQLRQTFERAFGAPAPAEHAWEQDGRWHDPFRPALEPDGFASRAELEQSCRTHQAAVRRVFTQADVFIFTLGLTEAWVSREDGAVFPVCPGTRAGRFDPRRHAFRNFTSAEVQDDLRAVIAQARAVNPGLRFLLTVSPVALAATAGGAHVLVANTYSKAVLRAVAGEVAADLPHVDYFPSYELVASHPMRAMFYRPDLRDVTPRGVALVMRHFFERHGVGTPGDAAATPPPHPDDVVCEELALASGR